MYEEGMSASAYAEMRARGYIKLYEMKRETYLARWEYIYHDIASGRRAFIEDKVREIMDNMIEAYRELVTEYGGITEEAEMIANRVYEMLNEGIQTERREDHAEVGEE